MKLHSIGGNELLVLLFSTFDETICNVNICFKFNICILLEVTKVINISQNSRNLNIIPRALLLYNTNWSN